MAISFIGSSSNSASPTTDTVVTLPGSMATNDLIIAVAVVGDTADNGLAAPTEGGYTDVLGASDLYSNDVNDCNLDLFYKFHNGTDTTVTFADAGGANASNAAVVMVFRGVALVVDGGPFDTTTVTATGINTSNADPPQIDHTGTAGVWTVIAGASGYGSSGGGTYTFPANYTTNAAQRTHNDTVDVIVGMGYNSAPADPENPGAFTAASVGTVADNAWCAVTMALKEGAAPPAATGTGWYGNTGWF